MQILTGVLRGGDRASPPVEASGLQALGVIAQPTLFAQPAHVTRLRISGAWRSRLFADGRGERNAAVLRLQTGHSSLPQRCLPGTVANGERAAVLHASRIMTRLRRDADADGGKVKECRSCLTFRTLVGADRQIGVDHAASHGTCERCGHGPAGESGWRCARHIGDANGNSCWLVTELPPDPVSLPPLQRLRQGTP